MAIDKITKDRRAQIRVPLLSETGEITLDHLFIKHFKISDISKDGCFLEDDNLLLTVKKVYELYLKLPGDLGTIKIAAMPVRCAWVANEKKNIKKGYGMKFILTANELKIIDSFVIYLRNKQIITVSKRIIEEFFGPKTPLF